MVTTTGTVRCARGLVGALILGVALSPACSGKSGGTLRLLADEYPTAGAALVKQRLDKLSASEHFILEFVGKVWKTYVFLRACEVDASIQWSSVLGGPRWDCATALAKAMQDEAQARSFGVDPLATVNSARENVLIYYKCKSGEIDASTCALYQQLTAQADAQSAAGVQQIIDNIGNRCGIGIDANCYP
jgi:hypothetical protein